MLINKAIYIYFCVKSASCVNITLDVVHVDETESEDSSDSDPDDGGNSFVNELAIPGAGKENLIPSNKEGIDFTHQERRTIEDIDENKATPQYSFVASIHRKGSHYANGALIHQRWVISSASEFYNVQESIKLFYVRLGTKNCKRGGTISKIKVVQVHPSFEPGQPHFDLSLLLLAVPVTVSNDIHPIHISANNLDILSAEFMSAYWPRILVNGELLPAHAEERWKPNMLRVSTQEVVPFAACARVVNGLQDSSFCLEPVKNLHSKCLPDPGAPVVASDGLWGITSGWKSEQCQLQPSPIVVTRVSPEIVRMWIDSQMIY